MTDILGFSKLIDTVSRGIGTAYEPVHKKRMAEASAKEIEIINKAIDRTTGLPIEYKNGKITINSGYDEKLLERTFNRLFQQEIVKQKNIDAIVEQAVIELSNVKEEKEISTKKVDTDWASRFMNSIEHVSDPEMQEIWGKILAGETKQPDTYNFRTLNVLKDISTREAKTFEKISQFILNSPPNNHFIIQSNTVEKKYNIDYGDLLLLEECGLINSSLVNFRINLTKDRDSFIYNSNILFSMIDLSQNNKKEETRKINLNVYKVTQAGIELLRVLNLKNNDDYVKDIFKEIKEEYSEKFGNDFQAKAYLIKKIEKNGEIFIDDNTDLLK